MTWDTDLGPAWLWLAAAGLAGIARLLWIRHREHRAWREYLAARQRFVYGRTGPGRVVMTTGGVTHARVRRSPTGGILVAAHNPGEAAEIVSQSDYFKPERRTA